MSNNSNKINDKIPFTAQPWFVFIMFIVFSPAGLYLMWKYKLYNKALRQIITSLCIGTFLLLIANLIWGDLEVPAPKNVTHEKSITAESN